jgi:hypothetical protein
MINTESIYSKSIVPSAFPWILTIAFAYCASFGASGASAHKPSDSYLKVRGGSEFLTIEWDIAIKDLEIIVGVDANQDGKITWAELKSQRGAIIGHALSRLNVEANGLECKLSVTELLYSRHSDGGYAVLRIKTDQPGNASHIAINYNLLFDIDPTHRGLVLYENGAVATTNILSPGKPTLEIKTDDISLWHTFVDYVREGVWHIWIGLDHVLFLISLLLTAVLIRKEDRWEAQEKFWPACRAVLKIVTVFTIAHSITLWLAVMEYVTLPGQAVEATIAFSIVIVAVGNIFARFSFSGWVVAFVFGLIHGFGFANVLVDLGLSSSALAVSLLAFNVGVELGQLAIVAVVFPIAFLIRKTNFYRSVVLIGGSLIIAILAAIWMYERIFTAEILGF